MRASKRERGMSSFGKGEHWLMNSELFIDHIYWMSLRGGSFHIIVTKAMGGGLAPETGEAG